MLPFSHTQHFVITADGIVPQVVVQGLPLRSELGESSGPEFVSSEVFFCFETVSGDVGVASTIASLVWSTSL